jgi:hypothetical protein
MKKLFLAMIIVIGLSAAMPLFAEKISEGSESEYYYVNVPLEKIYPYRKGYIVVYRKGVNQMTKTYLPEEWFTDAAGKGDLITLPRGAAWPYLAVYYKGGEFSHVRLYIHPSKAHVTWGNVPMYTNIDDQFENIEDIRLEF